MGTGVFMDGMIQFGRCGRAGLMYTASSNNNNEEEEEEEEEEEAPFLAS